MWWGEGVAHPHAEAPGARMVPGGDSNRTRTVGEHVDSGVEVLLQAVPECIWPGQAGGPAFRALTSVNKEILNRTHG